MLHQNEEENKLSCTWTKFKTSRFKRFARSSEEVSQMVGHLRCSRWWGRSSSSFSFHYYHHCWSSPRSSRSLGKVEGVLNKGVLNKCIGVSKSKEFTSKKKNILIFPIDCWTTLLPLLLLLNGTTSKILTFFFSQYE